MTENEKLDLILDKLSELNSELSGLKSEFSELKNDNRDIKLILENEIRVNIQRVAEGHLDLSRNLHEVMKPNNEIEMLAIKVNMLETEVRDLKRKIS